MSITVIDRQNGYRTWGIKQGDERERAETRGWVLGVGGGTLTEDGSGDPRRYNSQPPTHYFHPYFSYL